jgi:transposase
VRRQVGPAGTGVLSHPRRSGRAQAEGCLDRTDAASQAARSPATSRGGFTTKLHLVTDGTGLPLAVALSAGQAHESRYLEQVLDAVHIPPRTGGRRRQRPGALAGGKGYSYPRIRQWLRAHHVRAVIPERSDQLRQRAHRPGRKPTFDRAAYRQRHVIENCVGWLKEARGVATRHEKLAIHYLGLLVLGIIRRLLRPLSPQSGVLER